MVLQELSWSKPESFGFSVRSADMDGGQDVPLLKPPGNQTSRSRLILHGDVSTPPVLSKAVAQAALW